MIENPQRIEEFKAEIADLRLADPTIVRERRLITAGAAAMGLGLFVSVVCFVLSHNTNSTLEQRDWIIGALVGLGLIVGGAAVFLRYSLGQMARFWMARSLLEQRLQTDRLLEHR